MKLISRSREFRVDEENPYWITFSDLMSALLVIFILASVALIIDLADKSENIDKNIKELKNAEQARKDILHDIKDELAKQDIIVIIDINKSILRIPQTTLTFSPGSDLIPKSKEHRMSIIKIGIAIHRSINKQFDQSDNGVKKIRSEYLDTVFIEGHTDSRRFGRYKGNWGLSTFRAISLWEFWDEMLSVSPSFNEMVNSDGRKLFSVSGYASSRRIQLVEETEEQRKANRRIDIRFTIKRPSITKLKEIGVQ